MLAYSSLTTNAMWRFVHDHPWILATADGLYEARFSDERCAARSAASRGDGRYIMHERTGEIRSKRECVTIANRRDQPVLERKFEL